MSRSRPRRAELQERVPEVPDRGHSTTDGADEMRPLPNVRNGLPTPQFPNRAPSGNDTRATSAPRARATSPRSLFWQIVVYPGGLLGFEAYDRDHVAVRSNAGGEPEKAGHLGSDLAAPRLDSARPKVSVPHFRLKHLNEHRIPLPRLLPLGVHQSSYHSLREPGDGVVRIRHYRPSPKSAGDAAPRSDPCIRSTGGR